MSILTGASATKARYDTAAYVDLIAARGGSIDSSTQGAIQDFVAALYAAAGRIDCWMLCSGQNVGTGSKAYSLLGVEGTLVNGPTWGSSGIVFTTANSQSLRFPNPYKSTALNAASMLTVFKANNNTDYQGLIGGDFSVGFSPRMTLGDTTITGQSPKAVTVQFPNVGTNTVGAKNLLSMSVANSNTLNFEIAFGSYAKDTGGISYAHNGSTQYNTNPDWWVDGNVAEKTPPPFTIWNNTDLVILGARGTSSGQYFGGIISFAIYDLFSAITIGQYLKIRDAYKSTIGQGLSLP